MKKIVILGRGGAGKSTLARKLGELLNTPAIELDKHFWQPGLIPLENAEWISIQQKLASREKWIMDGDLGKYDVLSKRLKYADTVIILNFPFRICFIRALKRSKERLDFWIWLFTWRLIEFPKVMKTIKESASKNTRVIVLKSQNEVEKFIAGIQNTQPNRKSQ